jgi:hypothetical protein
VRVAPRPLLAASVVVQLAFSLLLAAAYDQYVSQYRDFAARLAPLAGSRRLWFNADWGLRYYLERIGGEHVLAERPLMPQTTLVTSRLGGMAAAQTLGRRREVLRAEIRTGTIPLAIIGLDSRSGNASAGFGLLPFDYGRPLLDEVVAEVIGVPEPAASYLKMSAPDAEDHLMLGFYQVEQNQWRWIGRRAMAVLKSPDSASGRIEFELSLHIPEVAPARTVKVRLDSKPLASQTYPGPGSYTLRAPAAVKTGEALTVEIETDQTFRVPGDSRDLGVIVTAFGFVPAR